jgi:hypothetical protein
MSVSKILNLGDDALAAKYFLVFPNGLPTGGDAESIALRMDQSFDFPEITVGEYEIGWKGMKVKKTNGTDQTDKTFTVQVRLDAQWKVMDDLYALAKASYDGNTGTYLPDSATRFPVAVRFVDGQDVVKKTWTFQYAKLKGFQIQSVEPVSEDPLRVQLTFIYASHKYE